MGVSIEMRRGEKWVDITPGWRSQMASWLQDISGGHGLLAFDKEHIPALKAIRKKQRKGEADPPFDHCEEWTKCFNQVIRQIEKEGFALVQLNY